MKPNDTLSIGEVARRTGYAVSAIRYYEDQGLIPEPIRRGGKRRYDPDVLTRLELVRIGQEAGFSLKEIEILLRGVDGSARSGTERLARLAETKLPGIEASLKRLRLLRRLLSAASDCRCPDLKACAAAARRAGLGGDQSVLD